MSGNFPWVRFTGAAIGLMGMGYAIMKATVPTDEELYNRMAPDLRRKVDATRAARLSREAEMHRRATAQTQSNASEPDEAKPVWANTPPPSK
ncbi:hypothetical protein BD779DRAFT_1195947 [Infundibulicybe gibba]|nr:hypothetical protein BD779DRAFT_1195947 [Infundibulicybe gibba]